MMQEEIMQAMFVFMIKMVLHGCKLEQKLMVKQQVITVVELLSSFPQMEQGWLSEDLIMMGMDPIQVM